MARNSNSSINSNPELAKSTRTPNIIMSATWSLITASAALAVGTSLLALAAPPVAELRLDNIDERGPYVEGDMVLPLEVRAGIKSASSRWPENTVVYVISPEFSKSEVNTIYEGMREISSKTCIRFRKRESPDRDYVSIVDTQQGCFSSVGRMGGVQTMNLGRGCVIKGVVAHELVHAIGFYHEQSRTDRDDFIRVNWDNVVNGRRNNNFDKFSSTYIDSFGVGYDYGSVMHYSAYAFAKDRSQKTIIVKQDGATVGQRVGLSSKDAQKINRMYGC